MGWGTGSNLLGRRLLHFLDRAGIAKSEVSLVVSGASGSVAGDRLDAEVLRSAFSGVSLPPVLAPKGVTGEYGGGFLASVVLATAPRAFGPTAGFREIDPEVGLTPWAGGTLPAPRAVLASSLGAGGAAAWAILEGA